MRRHGPVIAHCTDSEDFPITACDILCKQVELECGCMENIFVEIQINKNNILHLGTVYRSPNSTDDKNNAILNFISKLLTYPGYILSDL